MYWRLFYKFKGVKGLNEAIENREIKDVESFLKVYLDRPFDSNDSECFKIFYFIDDIDSKRKDSNLYKLCESIMIGSTYFETMPQEKVIDALYEFKSIVGFDTIMKQFSKHLIAKITDSKLLLEYSLTDIANLFESYLDMGFEDKIMELGIDYIIKLSEELEYPNNKFLLEFCKEYFSLEEMKSICRQGDFLIANIYDVVLKNYDALEFDLLFNIMINKTSNQCSPFESFLTELNEDEKIANQHKNYIANKLLESKNCSKMLVFLANIECGANENLIAELVGKVPEFILLDTIPNKHVFLAVKKILEQGEVNTMGINTIDAIFLGQYDYEKLECILDSLYKIKSNIKFSKKTTIYLLKLGVKKFPTLINEYEFTEEERLEILTSLKEINSDWLIIYGNYLAIGNNITKTSEKIAMKQITRIRNLKSHREEM